MKARIFFLAFMVVAFCSCKLSKSYTITKLSDQVNCSCDEISNSIKFFKKSYKSEKSIEVYGGILLPIDRINEEDYVYTEFKVVKDCLDIEFKKSEDEYYFIISEDQWENIKAYSCN